MNSLRLFTLSACFLTLVGCSSIPVQTVSTVPPALLQPCPPLQHLPESKPGQSSMGDLYQHDKDLMQQYTVCAIQLQKLQELGAVAAPPASKAWYQFWK